MKIWKSGQGPSLASKTRSYTFSVKLFYSFSDISQIIFDDILSKGTFLKAGVILKGNIIKRP